MLTLATLGLQTPGNIKYYKLAAEQGSEIGKAKAHEFEMLKFYK